MSLNQEWLKGIQSLYCLYLTEIDWHCLLSLCVCVQVCLAKIGGQPISHLLHTHRQKVRERESLVTLLLRDLLLPRGGWGKEPAAHTAEWTRREERSEWMDSINEWRARSGTRLTGFVCAGIEHASLAGSGRQCYLLTDLLPNGLPSGEAASCSRSIRPEPVPAPACAAHTDMGPVCCKPDRLKKQHLQGNGKQLLEIFN